MALRADAGDLPAIANEAGVVRTGASAAAEHGFDIVASHEVDAYIRETEYARLADKYFLDPSARPNVTLRLVPEPWPFPATAKVAPPAVAALDLLDSADERVRRAGRATLEQLDAP